MHLAALGIMLESLFMETTETFPHTLLTSVKYSFATKLEDTETSPKQPSIYGKTAVQKAENILLSPPQNLEKQTMIIRTKHRLTHMYIYRAQTHELSCIPQIKQSKQTKHI